MGTENKSNARQRKKVEKSNDSGEEVVKKDLVSNGEEVSKQRKQCVYFYFAVNPRSIIKIIIFILEKSQRHV